MGFPGGSDSEEPICQHRSHGFNPWVGKIPWSRKRQPTLVFLPAESHGQRSLAGYSPQSHKESDMTEQLNTRYSIHSIKSYFIFKCSSVNILILDH